MGVGSLRYAVWRLRFAVCGLGFEVWGVGCTVAACEADAVHHDVEQGFGQVAVSETCHVLRFGVWGLGFGVWGLGAAVQLSQTRAKLVDVLGQQLKKRVTCDV